MNGTPAPSPNPGGDGRLRVRGWLFLLLLGTAPRLVAAGGPGEVPGLWHDEQAARSREVGLARYVLTRPVQGGLDRPPPGGSDRVRLPVGTRVELLSSPPILEGRPWALLADGRVVWVPREALRPDPYHLDPTREALIHLPGARIDSPPYCEVPGVYRSEITWRSARLHLVEVDLDTNSELEFFPVVTEYFLRERGRGRRVALVRTMLAEAGGMLAANGTYFSTGSRNWGTPLGPLVAHGEVLADGEDPSALLRKRSFLAWTSHGRFVTGELDGRVAQLMGRHRGRGAAGGVLRAGERVVHLVGGLGRLARGGDPEAWRAVFRSQFDARFYSRSTRRAQILFGVGEGGRTLYLLAQVGHPHSRRRCTLPELGWILVGLGAREVLFGDGGGSTDLVFMGRELVPTENHKERRKVSSALVLRQRP